MLEVTALRPVLVQHNLNEKLGFEGVRLKALRLLYGPV